MPDLDYIRELSKIDSDDIAQLGEKLVSLGGLIQNGVTVPSGFVITNGAYQKFIEENNIQRKIDSLLSSLNLQNPQEIQKSSLEIQKLILHSKIPQDIVNQVKKRYSKMGGVFKQAYVEVSQSICPPGKGINQEETYSNIQGEAVLLSKVRGCWASFFTPRAIVFLLEHKLDLNKIGIAVLVQEIVESEISGFGYASGKDKMIIEAVWGEHNLDGEANPDRYLVQRETGNIIEIENNPQESELIRRGKEKKLKKLSKAKSNKQKLTRLEIVELSRILSNIHKHYFFPQIVEWVYKKGKFYILKIKPLSSPLSEGSKAETLVSGSSFSKVLFKGGAVSPGLTTGIARVILSDKDYQKLKKGEILVTKRLSPDYAVVFKLASGIITSEEVTSHTALMCRELGIPCIASGMIDKLKDGDVITINGVDGTVYKGSTNIKKTEARYVEQNNRDDIKTATKLYVNLSDVKQAEKISTLSFDGVGLIQGEFFLSQIGVHPKQLIKTGRQKLFIEKLTESLETFCKYFEGKPVVYKTTDFTTNEYRHLDGGKSFEPEELNPLFGFRGALRYITDPSLFDLELIAIKKVREKYKNLWISLPFVRSPQELREVKRVMAGEGLVRSPSFKIWMMVDLPVNVILIDDFINVGIDGVSIDINNLAIFLTGIDMDNKEISSAFNELSPVVLWSIEKVSKAVQKAGVTSCICGKAIGLYDSLIEEAVKSGVSSISIKADVLGRIKSVVSETERRIGR